MRLDEKRKVIEVLLCCAQDPDDEQSAARTTWEIARYWLELPEVEKPAGRLWRAADDERLSHGDICIEAAYRLIESSPTLRREWFKRGARCTMIEWMLAHPWLTFFVAVVGVGEIGRTIRAIATRKQKRLDMPANHRLGGRR